jgi:hypothetical protein
MGMGLTSDHDRRPLGHAQIALAQLDSFAFDRIDREDDDLMQRRAEQVILAIVLRLAHRALQPRSATGSNFEAKRLKALEEENAKLKKLLAEQMTMVPPSASSF